MSDLSLTFDTYYNAKELFGIDFPQPIAGFKHKTDSVPEIDADYYFNPEVTRALLVGLVYNKRVLVHGTHGTGKSTHIEQICARLNIPCLRINLDGQISRADLIGRDAIILENGQQVTQFKEGILPTSLRRACVLVLDEYDAGRPEVMFVIQRLLEDNGRLALLEKSEIITPHPNFRIFATANTIGLGDNLGLYHGTRILNQAQMDRWSLTVKLSFMKPDIEATIIANKVSKLNTPQGNNTIKKMVNLATMIRIAFANDEISGSISPRAVLAWAENSVIFDDIELAFRLSYLNRIDEMDYDKIAEFYQRCFGQELACLHESELPHFAHIA
jgi:cobaltochelatase CobS